MIDSVQTRPNDLILSPNSSINDEDHHMSTLESPQHSVSGIAIDTHVNGNSSYDGSDVAGSSPQDSETIPTPADEPMVDVPSKDLSVKSDVDMAESNSLSIVSPPSPAPSGVSQPIRELSLNDVSRSSPSYSAPISPRPASTTPPAPNGHLAPSAPHRERPVNDLDVTTDEQRPAKRARTADVASPAAIQQAPTTPPTPPPTHTTISPAQFKFALSTLRSLRKNKDAGPFNQPVDPVVLGIPHYLTVIKRPMDLSTIDTKLNASNPTKPDPNHNAPRYSSIQGFIADMKLVFDNCYLFNGLNHVVSQCAKRLQAVFERSLKNMPPPQAPAPLFKAPTPVPTPAPPPPPPEPKKPIRRSSTAVPTIRRSDEATATEFAASRPRREIHPPPPKDIDYAEPTAMKRPKLTKSSRNAKRKDDGTLEQLRYCLKIVNDLYKKQHATYANFFYDPVDVRQVPNYYKVIKSPMDLSTLKRKLEQKEYPNANTFLADWKLMMKNCVAFNPVGTMVYVAGQDMQRVFDEKWKGLPPLHTPPPSSDEEDEPTVQSSMIENLESQLNSLRDTIDALKSQKKKEAKRPASSAPKVTSASSRPRSSTSKKASSSTKKTGSRKLEADAVLSFEEKKELSETIQSLEGSALEEVIQIIHDGVPEIGDNADEIEIEIDALPPAVLRQLWNTVIKPKPAAAAAKPSKSGKNHPATGGVKRKSMDEHAEAQKMRELEARINMFNNADLKNGVAANGAQKHHTSAAVAAHDSGSDSESDSGSDSSDSD
ncbi:Bromodomain-containing protein [Cantharellus anzutake]|uniref:Bromodomain-containing protein n=1 Tax=Cantharellus anzutake TaxID=1750568 RepID=UPI001907D309|nr:Bromodomain-containing protein [Cantharellus anzutake]KAF8338313.1 Bromodomain-containing protein [Cantharellus anzutake]